MRLDVSMEELLPVPIERAWQALTDPAMIEGWLMRTYGFEARVGARFSLGEEPARADCRGPVDCEVLELSPPHRMVWSWQSAEDPAATRLVIELEPSGGGETRLMLRHTGEADEGTVRSVTGGWADKLPALAELLTTTGGGGND